MGLRPFFHRSARGPKDGAIELGKWNFEENDPMVLKGERRFAWEKFIEPKAE